MLGTDRALVRQLEADVADVIEEVAAQSDADRTARLVLRRILERLEGWGEVLDPG